MKKKTETLSNAVGLPHLIAKREQNIHIDIYTYIHSLTASKSNESETEMDWKWCMLEMI